jgi:hypothetical protein
VFGTVLKESMLDPAMHHQEGVQQRDSTHSDNYGHGARCHSRKDAKDTAHGGARL